MNADLKLLIPVKKGETGDGSIETVLRVHFRRTSVNRRFQ